MAEQLHEIIYSQAQPGELGRMLVLRGHWFREGDRVFLRQVDAPPIDITDRLTGPTPKFAISEEP